METTKGPGKGFASMQPEMRRQVARKGGRAAHEQGKAHEWTREEARVVGRKGGLGLRLKRWWTLNNQPPNSWWHLLPT